MFIYKTTNIINGKIYVGQDSSNNPKYLGSGILFQKALNKYGRENFIKIKIDTAYTQEELDNKEEFWIDFLNATNPKIGYNLSKKAFGLHKGYKYTEEQKQKGKNKNRGIFRSDRTRQRMSNSNLGKHIYTSIIREKVSNTRKEKYLSKELVPYWEGKERGIEFKQTISKKNSKSILQYDLQDNFIKEWPSEIGASKELHCNPGDCARGLSKTAGGFKWKYKTKTSEK
jgi:group I intron endonuclease